MTLNKMRIAKVLGGVALATLLLTTWVQSTLAAGMNQPTEHSVDIIKFKYVPAVLNVKKGDTVTWTNRDIVPHTATSIDGSMDTGEIKMGESRSLVIESDTTISYICTYHPTMKGEIRP